MKIRTVTLWLATNKTQQHLCAVMKLHEEDAAHSNKNISCCNEEHKVRTEPTEQNTRT
jgi:hypothetical protein